MQCCCRFLGSLVVAQAAVPSQIHIAYTQDAGEFSVDFVGDAKDGVVQFGSASPPTTNATTTSFNYAEIGWMHQVH